MTNELPLLDGTISYRPEPNKSVDYKLVVSLSEEVAKKLTPWNLHRLQVSYHGQVSGTFTPDGVLDLHAPIIANGPESALYQAQDLARAFKEQLGLELNVAAGIGVRPSDFKS